MDNISLYLPFTKADEDQRIVEGYASTEAVDSQGEIVRSDALEKALPDYMKFANIREMHQWSAVGKTLHAKVDGEKKGLFIKGKIVDTDAWQKVKEKVYSGFSIGGKVLKKVGNVIQELVLNEISLVDRPANPEAVFSLVKFEKGGEIVEKQLPIAAAGMDGEDSYPGIKVADQLIAIATQLTYLKQHCDDIKRPSKHIEKAINILKQAALFELQAEKVAVESALIANQTNKKEALDVAKRELQKAVSYKSYPNWTKSYYETHREVV